MQTRLAHTTDAAAVNELLHQLGYPQDGTATTATRIQTSGAELFATSRGCVRMEVTSADRRQDAHEFYRRRGYTDQTGRSSQFQHNLNDTNRGESRASEIARRGGQA
jgi:hypothetical protein